MNIRRLAALRTREQFEDYLKSLGLDLPIDPELETGPWAPLSQPLILRSGATIGNRFCVQPMEGWDGTETGFPTEWTERRWRNFGRSGCKLIWGGEAVAVCPEGRANPNQLLINPQTLPALSGLRSAVVTEHTQRFGRSDDLLIGLQLTHSGRFARPNRKDRLEPVGLYRHPILDARCGIGPDQPLITDDEIDAVIAQFVEAAEWAQQAGFAFVDIKHCHGYLGHEFLSAVDRPGRFGGSFENRTRFLRDIVAGVRRHAPGLQVGVRLSAFDLIAFRSGPNGVGEPLPTAGAYPYAFGGDGSGLGIDLTETHAFLELLTQLGIELVNLTAGSPYYTPHIQRPALFPPSDGYRPPEDPLVGVARQIKVVATLKRLHPNLLLVGSGYSYLQEWLPYVAQAVVRRCMADSVGVGRMILAYPEFPADILSGRGLQRKRLCRTLSECTTAPRQGRRSGCYPLDPAYQGRWDDRGSKSPLQVDGAGKP